MSRSVSSDVALAKSLLSSLPVQWDGRQAILAMQSAGFNQWRQMEWFGFYFEFLAQTFLGSAFIFPGDRYASTTFDLKGGINWDLKSSAINARSRGMILNDVAATDLTIKQHGSYGLLIALCEAEYNDEDRSFYNWHAALKGETSAYELKRIARAAPSRQRKVAVTLREILFVSIDSNNIHLLKPKKQGQNSNERPRPLKYNLYLPSIDPAIIDRLVFP